MKEDSDLLRRLCSASPLRSATFGKGHRPIYKIPTPCCRVSFLLPEVDERRSVRLSQYIVAREELTQHEDRKGLRGNVDYMIVMYMTVKFQQI